MRLIDGVSMISFDSIIGFFQDELGLDTDDIEPSTLLFTDSIVDSFALVSILLFLEGQANIEISPRDVNLDNFDSIERMLAYVERVAA